MAKRFVIAVDESGKAYLRNTVSIARDLGRVEQVYFTTPVARPKRLSLRQRLALGAAVQMMLGFTRGYPASDKRFQQKKAKS